MPAEILEMDRERSIPKFRIRDVVGRKLSSTGGGLEKRDARIGVLVSGNEEKLKNSLERSKRKRKNPSEATAKLKEIKETKNGAAKLRKAYAAPNYLSQLKPLKKGSKEK